MHAKTLTILIVVVLTGLLFAGTDNKPENPWTENDWPFEMLPKWETKAEKEAPYQGTDRLTPPPTGTVILDAEFAPREGTILRYPYGFGDQPFLGMVDNLQEYGVVYILVENAAVESDCYNYITSNGIPWNNIECIHVQTDANWTRDYGPWFVWEEDSSLSIIDMIYYSDRPHDDYVPEFLESYWGMDYYGPDIHHEGGNLMTDGNGTMMMTTHVFEANPSFTTEDVNEIHHDYFGQDTTYIFERIDLDATGHIDLWSKLMNDSTILVAQMQPNDVNYQLVENHAARMAQIPTIHGGTFNIVRCPMPPVQYYWIFPYYKSYINSVLFNNLALIPIYGLQWDNEAIAAYQQALGPSWDVIGVDCNSIAWAGGAIHCTTISVPYHEWDYVVDVDITLEPQNPPIIIPSSGGSFDFYIEVENLETESISFEVWLDVTLPNGTTFGPILVKKGLNLSALASIGRTLTQYIPENAPPGMYQFHAYAGHHLPEVICAEAFFEFEKIEEASGLDPIPYWGTFGWDEKPGGSVDDLTATLPKNFTLGQNYPNPFNPETTIPFTLQNDAEVELAIYNINGQLLDVLVRGNMGTGSYETVWNAADVPSGVYFYSLTVGGQKVTKKLLLLK